MKTDMNDNIPDLKIEQISDGLIMLEQNSSGNVDRICIHPLHVRYLAEKMGIVETSDVEAQRLIALLKRRLVAITDRICHLASYMQNHSDHTHSDLTYETDYLVVTAGLASDFRADIEVLNCPAYGNDRGVESEAARTPNETDPANE